MNTMICALLVLLMASLLSGTPVEQPSVEDRIQKLEGSAELGYEFTHDMNKRLSVLERFVAGLLRGNASSETLLDGDIVGKADYSKLQESLTHQLSETSNDTLPVLYAAAARAVPGIHVAFHAYAGVNRMFSPNEVVIFDHTTTNEGYGYTSTDGIFDAPATGVYVFTWTISTRYNSQPFSTHLVVNGDVRGILTTNSDYDVNVGTGSGSHPATGIVVTHVEAGNHVFIRMVNMRGTASNLESDQTVRSSFSGWLLF